MSWDTRGLTRFSDPMVITFEDFLEKGAQAHKQHPDLFLDRMARGDSRKISAVLIYTSGTTGPPKGAMLSHGNVTWMADAVAATNPVYDTDQVLSFLPLCHIFERLFTVFIQIRYAYTVNFVEKPDTVMQNMMEVSPTVGYAVPRIWEKYYSNVMIKMADADWFKRAVFQNSPDNQENAGRIWS
ncbi:MAG: AMP-binding protein [Desulfotignum sp.]|nr:AMP-binding protein [Desulfotignum sp.]